ncbi:IspD/TarI family cytidylyltransferase [Salsipaludibacter albus]|uniref:IspD/TarI family cytidylyltransferase n=1 Tax=Salsipaludibacter albus TaxID=2849650 RepID=UPI001EE40BCE|nr:2-C-methyl-D-erythritol 4-phosphate cytidylyltransferase [Salsipaludibacter albus]MBY5160944.1 2-C-methyl-D-erythritol 4-phosphate cytidylyltransferase [Salsipaludibacter albus]
MTPEDDVDRGGAAGGAGAAVAGVVVAGGSGERLGAEVPKAFVEVEGATLLVRAVAALRAGGVERIVAVVPVGWEDRAVEDLADDVVVVAGGRTRTASVAAGLAALPPDVTVVAVHDAARAFVPASTVSGAVAAVARAVPDVGDERGAAGAAGVVVAAAPGLAVGDTLKRVDGGRVVGTVERADLVAVQTPQVFHRTVLQQAHDRAARDGAAATDDLALVEGLVADGLVPGRVLVTTGSPLAMKITRPDDLVVASALAFVTDDGDAT